MDPRIAEIRKGEINFRGKFEGARYKFRMSIGWFIVPFVVLFVVGGSLISGIKAQARAEALAESVPIITTPVVRSVVDESAKEAVICPSNALESVRQWCDLVNSKSHEYGIDPTLVLAVMTQESGGQDDAISENGAVGLMQIMPNDGVSATFECANGPCFANRPSTKELLDPEFNIDYGARMLAGLINKYGSEKEALKAYGPYNVGYDFADKVLAIRERIKQ